MAETSRDYANKLIGGWDRSQYIKQGDVAEKSTKTKWDVLKNQFTNLKAQLEAQKTQAQQDYTQGLGNVADTSFDRINQSSADLVGRGLTTSGAANVLNQMDTKVKGGEVNKLLDSLGNTMSSNAKSLQQGGDNMNRQGMGLNKDLGDTLAALSNRDMSSQMEYNQGAANIAESKEVREFNNKMAARSRGGGGGGGGRSSKDQADEDALNEFYRKASINEVLTDETLTDKQKASIMKVGLGVGDPSSLLSNYMEKPKAVDYTYKKPLTKQFSDFMKNGGIYGAVKNYNKNDYDVNLKNAALTEKEKMQKIEDAYTGKLEPDYTNYGENLKNQILATLQNSPQFKAASKIEDTYVNKIDPAIAAYAIKQKAQNEANKVTIKSNGRAGKDPTQLAIEEWLAQFSSVKR